MSPNSLPSPHLVHKRDLHPLVRCSVFDGSKMLFLDASQVPPEYATTQEFLHAMDISKGSYYLKNCCSYFLSIAKFRGQWEVSGKVLFDHFFFDENAFLQNIDQCTGKLLMLHTLTTPLSMHSSSLNYLFVTILCKQRNQVDFWFFEGKEWMVNVSVDFEWRWELIFTFL